MAKTMCANWAYSFKTMAIIRTLLLYQPPLFLEGFQLCVRTWLWGFVSIQRGKHQRGQTLMWGDGVGSQGTNGDQVWALYRSDFHTRLVIVD